MDPAYAGMILFPIPLFILKTCGAKMLEIDTILRTVCIVEKSIYSGGLANVGRMPAFFML